MDPYEVLGLTASASDDDIETQYRLLLRRHHPDMHQSEGPRAVAQAEYATRLLNQAMTQIRGERERRGSNPGAATGATGPGDGERAHARPRATPPGAAAGAATDAPPQAEGPWWAGPQKAGSPCPFCGLHIADYPSYEAHLQDSHRVRIEAQRRRGIPISISRGLADLLTVAAMLVAAVALLWLSMHIQLNAIIWFLLWLGTVALFLPTMLMRPRNRRR